MTRVNQKSMVPRFPDATPGLLSRGRILDGTVKTYFGPGQTAFDTDRASGYAPPTDWPAAGTLLRVPQVAWLATGYPDDNLPQRQQLYSGPALSYSYRYTRQSTGQPFEVFVWTDGHEETVTDILWGQGEVANAYIHIDIEGMAMGIHLNAFCQPVNQYPEFDTLGAIVYDETVANPWAEARDRVLAAFAEARQTLEALRPGRTWVAELNFASDEAQLAIGFGFAGLAAPEADVGFFGTRFVQVTAGAAMQSGFPPLSEWWPPPPSDADEDLAAVAATWESFALYRSDFFGPAGDWAAFPATPPTPVFPPAPLTVAVDGQVVPTERERWPAGVQASYDRLRADVAELDDRLGAVNDRHRDLYHGFVASLPEGVARYLGEDDAVTGPAIVALIAAHFGFDPATGRDLG